MDDLISRQAAINAKQEFRNPNVVRNTEARTAYDRTYANGWNDCNSAWINAIKALPSAQPEKEIAKRVLWTGWKGYRNTRYKCPNCKKPVKNDDIYCHRCGQKLMFPHISFTDYVPGEKQETIVRWDDE